MGFVDLQVNGYAGVDFNADSLSEADLLNACRQLATHGVDQLLATVITAPLPTMISRIQRIATLIDGNHEIAGAVAGIHVEGPFINPADGFVGAHPPAAVIPASVDAVQRLLAAGGGHVRMVTLAPEFDPGAHVTALLAGQQIIVAAGHCDPTLDQLQAAIDQGLTMFTHLGNGCPGKLNRHDNIIQRVLSLSDQLMISFIADGHHVPRFALANYLRCVPETHVVIVSDAIAAAGLGPGEYQFCDQRVIVDPDGATWAADRSHFAGCATPQFQMADWLRSQLGISDRQIQEWFAENPRRILQKSASG